MNYYLLQRNKHELLFILETFFLNTFPATWTCCTLSTGITFGTIIASSPNITRVTYTPKTTPLINSGASPVTSTFLWCTSVFRYYFSTIVTTQSPVYGIFTVTITAAMITSQYIIILTHAKWNISLIVC